MNSTQPLGYLVKKLDNVLNAYVDAVLRSQHGVGRPHWQALRTAADDRHLPLSKFTSEALEFYTEAELEDLLVSLTENGWIYLDNDDGIQLMTITSAGEELLKRMTGTQNNTMQIATDGISETDYETAHAVLARMASNLEVALDSAHHDHGTSTST